MILQNLDIRLMRKDQKQIIKSINDYPKLQLYLLEASKTSQQKFLHLLCHKNLIKNNIFHCNLDRVLGLLQGSFISNNLKLTYVAKRIQNKIEITEQTPLLKLVEGWVNFYPTIKVGEKCLIKEITLQKSLQYSDIENFQLFLTYLNIISPDIWKTIRNIKEHKDFLLQKSFKEELTYASQEINIKRLDINDMLSFIHGCIPKTLLNIILDKESLPMELRAKYKMLQCLYSNQNMEYYLKNYTKLALVFRQLLIILLVCELNSNQQKNLASITMKYFLIYHYDKKYFAPQIFIYVFNKIDDQVKKTLVDDFTLFFKVAKKLGKLKFLNYMKQNSAFVEKILTFLDQNPIIGYAQNTVSPYNGLNITQTVQILRGATEHRIFEVLQEFSIIYVKIKATSFDITCRLCYLGQIQSQKQTKTVVMAKQKFQEHLTSIVATRRGLYMLQFDNSYSWINNKEVSYEMSIYVPLEMKSINYDDWIQQYYDGLLLNEIANPKDIVLIMNKRIQPKNIIGIAQLGRKKEIFNLKLGKKTEEEYIYETDNPERMKQKIKQLLSSKSEEYRWKINNKTIQNDQQLIQYIQQQSDDQQQPEQQEKSTMKEEEEKQDKRQEKKEIILAKYESDDQEEYQVKERQQSLEISTIFNQEKQTGLQNVSEQEEVRKEGAFSKEKQDTVQKGRKQQQISSYEQAEES